MTFELGMQSTVLGLRKLENQISILFLFSSLGGKASTILSS